ncbi:hypothetical protein D3C81_2057490 [compost metagenome]
MPLVVLETPGGFGRAFLLEQVQALLIGTQPQVGEVEGIARLRQRQQQRQAQQPATASRAGRQQQEREQQPVALIGPGVQA